MLLYLWAVLQIFFFMLRTLWWQSYFGWTTSWQKLLLHPLPSYSLCGIGWKMQKNLFCTHAYTNLCVFNLKLSLCKRFLSVKKNCTHSCNMEQSTGKALISTKAVLEMREEGKQAVGRKILSHLLCWRLSHGVLLLVFPEYFPKWSKVSFENT